MKQIDQIDEQLLRLLSDRAGIVQEIGKAKKTEGAAFYVPSREEKILAKLSEKNQGPLPNKSIQTIYKEIISACRSLEYPIKVAYLGPAGTFHHIACIKKFGASAEFIPLKSVEDVFASVEKQNADYGVVAIENSTAGVVGSTLDMFVNSQLKIYSETSLEIRHHLLANCSLEKIKKVYTHPQALAQCRTWLEDNLPNAILIECQSTANGAELAAKEDGVAAIGSELLADMHNLKIVAKGIQDVAGNKTRFIVLGTHYSPKSGNDKTSILLFIKNQPGALFDCIVPFKNHNVNMTTIQSRPTKQEAWRYMFYIDFVGHQEDEPVKDMLEEIEKECLYLKVLGSYPIERD